MAKSKKILTNNINREDLANPFSKVKIKDQLKMSDSADMNGNFKIERLNSKFAKIKPIDPNKKFKK